MHLVAPVTVGSFKLHTEEPVKVFVFDDPQEKYTSVKDLPRVRARRS